MARPLYTALAAELSAMIAATAPPFQPEIVPSSVAKMNDAALPFANLKTLAVPFRTWPVGRPNDPAGDAAPGGMVTTVAFTVPAPLYKVDVPVRWFETQNGLVALKEIPHGSTRLGSTMG